MNLEPLLGLATNQVDQATLTDHNIEAYHCDEHKGKVHVLLMNCLRKYNCDGEESKYVTINIFIGPKALMSSSWKELLEKLARDKRH